MRLSRIVGAVLPGRRRPLAEPEPDNAGSGATRSSTPLPTPAPSSTPTSESSAENLLALLPPELREPPRHLSAPSPLGDAAEAGAAPLAPLRHTAPQPETADDLLALLPPELRQGAGAPSAAPPSSEPTPSHSSALPPTPAPAPSPAPDLDLGALLAAEFRHPTRHRPEAERAGRPGLAPRPSLAAPRPIPASGPDIAAAAEIAGFLAACLVDAETGLLLASEGGGGLDLEAAAAVSAEVLRAELAAVLELGLEDRVEEILATTGRQLHLLRPLERTSGVFLFVALDRRAANLGMARRQIARLEAGLEL